LRSIDSATLTGSYQAVGGPLLKPSYILKLVNNSTALVTISVDGINDVDISPAGSFWLYDEGKVGISSHIPAMPVGTQIYVKGSAGVGSIYLVSQYIVQS
jgi:sugar lactone lactonase YvrE